jgi:8-oxo-dGTP diphosphatase
MFGFLWHSMSMEEKDVHKKDSHERIIVAVDVLVLSVIEGKLRALLIQIDSGHYAGKWAIPGGIVYRKESLNEAAERILEEKAGVNGIYLEQLYTFGDPNRDARGRSVSVAYFALVNSERFHPKTTEYYRGIAWQDIDHLPDLAFDHTEVIRCGVERLRTKIAYSNIAYGLLPRAFTLSEMQSVYESIMGKSLDKRNFRKRILSLGLLRETGDMRRGEVSRPAKLYAFRIRKAKIVKML